MQTFNQIITAFQTIATAHKQINTFGVGDIWEIETSGTITYPLMWAQPDISRVEENVFVSSWKLLFMDIIHKDERNENDVLSDMELVALDIIAQLQSPSYEFDFNANGIILERFTERFTDYVGGVMINVELRIPYNADRCAIPSSTITTGTNTNVVLIVNAVTGATIASLVAPTTYQVYQWSGIDEGDSTTTYSDGITEN